MSAIHPATPWWTQRWVGTGATLWLEGGLDEGAMVLTGTSPRRTSGGEVLDRITWTPLPAGEVRQTWEISRDGGVTRAGSFVGVYGPSSTAPAVQ